MSVLVPVFNGERFLDVALASLRRQSLQDFEVITINDGSKDASGQIAEAYAHEDDRFKVIHQENSGVVTALNTGAQEAQADIIARLDADDFCRPERLEKQLALMDANPDVVCCGSAIETVDENGEKLNTRTFPTNNGQIQARILSRGCFAHSAVVYRRAAFERAGKYRPGYESVEDLDLFLRLSEIGEMANLPDVLTCYRIHADQVTSQPSPQHRLQGLLAVAAALQRRQGRAEVSPDMAVIDRQAIKFIESWIADAQAPWTWHIVSAIHGLARLMSLMDHSSLTARTCMRLLSSGQLKDALEVLVATGRSRFGFG